MDISAGYRIEAPDILIPWNISPEELRKTLGMYGLQEMDGNNFGIRCVSLGGLMHMLGIRFDERPDVGIWYFQLSQNGATYPAGSFDLFQKHLEMTFGEPTTIIPGEEGFPSYTWRHYGCVVYHRVQERFGPAEIVRIERHDSDRS
jgi:hypothetical protein